MTRSELGETRREFLQRSAALAAVSFFDWTALAGSADGSTSGKASGPGTPLPWYKRTLRWGQTNITEIDAQRYDIPWWRQHWRRTRIQGVFINAGGIYASYPSKFPLHYRAPQLGDRDLYGELARAAHEDGLAVIARMDSNRVHEAFFQAHPDWFARDIHGEPYRLGELYVTCVNSPYYDEYIPSVLREIIERSHPEGFGDNNWNGLERDKFCYCANCERKFLALTGQSIPRQRDWEDTVFRQWVDWNYARRMEIWDLNNRATRDAGGPDCLWIGMNSGSLPYQGLRFRDYKAICERSELFLLDDQMRNDNTGFQHNGQIGKLIHGLLGWDKLIPESMAMYQMGRSAFRVASKPEPEARLWMLEGLAGGVQPWWHHVGAFQEDRRMFRTAEPVFRWHAENQQYLVQRRPIANVGMVWNQQNTDFYGRDNPEELVELPWRGWTNALLRARIPCLPVHADKVGGEAGQFSVIILPNVAAMSAAQAQAVRDFVARGGSVIATGETSRYSERGDRLEDFALGALFGAHIAEGKPSYADSVKRAMDGAHTYLRLHPQIAAKAYGPGSRLMPTEKRHPVLSGFGATDILAFGGILDPLRVDSGVTVAATFIPAFPTFPPEQAYIHEFTDIPGVILKTFDGGGRVAFVPADIDRRYGRDNLPDHAQLMENLVRWAARDEFPLEVEGAGLVDCHLYEQPSRLILHLVNLTNPGTWRGPIEEFIQIGPLKVRVRLPGGTSGRKIRSLVTNDSFKPKLKQGWVRFEVETILDHEVVLIT